MDLDPRYLQVFFAVCREGGFGRAAVALHRTQPAVSYQVRMLEQQLGAPLVERGVRPLLLTPAGRRLRDFCERFFSELGEVAAAIDAGAPAREDPLHLASVSGFGRYVLFPLLCEPRFAQLRYSLRFPTAQDVLRGLEDGRYDLGVVYLPHVSSALRVEHLRDEELVLVAAPGFDASPAALRALPTYAGLPFVTYDEHEYVFGKWFDAQFGRPPTSLRSACHFEELEEVLEMVALGRGLSVVPDHVARRAVVERRLCVLRPTARRATNTLYAAWRAGAGLRPSTALLLEGLRQGGAPAPARRR